MASTSKNTGRKKMLNNTEILKVKEKTNHPPALGIANSKGLGAYNLSFVG